MVLINITVRKDNDIGTVFMCTVYFQEQTVNGLFKGSVLIISDGESLLPLKPGFFMFLIFNRSVSVRIGFFYTEDLAVFRCLLQDIALFTYIYSSGSNDLLTDGIDRRVGNLCK